jgi:zinc protease
MRKTFFGFVILLVIYSLPALSQIKKENIHPFKLSNGLKVILVEKHDIPNIAYYTFFHVGSRNERVGITGVSHFIEHMMFNGTEKNGPGEFDKIMEFNGGANNAYTANDMTVYTDWFPSSVLEKMMDLEADRMQGSAFKPEVLESERGVVASERRNGENNNESVLSEVVDATAIMAHPYHWSVIGWMSDILSWKRDDIVEYYKTYYAPNNAILVVVGDFKLDNMIELIKSKYEKIPAGKTPPQVTTKEPEQIGERRVKIDKEAQTPSFRMVYPAVEATNKDYTALAVLDLTLFSGESSRLYKKLVKDMQIAVSVYGGIDETLDPNLFSFIVKPKTGADLTKIETSIEEELKLIAEKGITEKEFQKAKNLIKTGFYSPLETISGLANLLGRTELIYGDYEYIFKIVDNYDKVQLKDVQTVAAKYFTPSKKTVGIIIAKGGKNEK